MALTPYLQALPVHAETLGKIRLHIRDRFRVATTLVYRVRNSPA